MSTEIINAGPLPLRGEITPPGDKSITHRSLMLGAIAEGVTSVKGFLRSDDTASTAEAMRAMGAQIESSSDNLKITGRGLRGLKEPESVIDAGNSGTTARLLTGLLCAQSFSTELTGDKYLRERPMKRVVEPLRLMGAEITGNEDGNKLPLVISGRKLRPVSYEMPVASAQVKSAILLAGLYAEGRTEVIEKNPTRDHTERMLSYMGVQIERNGSSISVNPPEKLSASGITVPADISSAAFFIVAALINRGSEVLIKNVGLNPLRTGVIDILREMGGNIEALNLRELNGEPVSDLAVKSSDLHGVSISSDIIPKAIDELPVLAVAACFAEGETIISDASELRVKETDRIKAITSELRKLGASVEEFEDGMKITGTGYLKGAVCSSWGDHRIAMSVAVAGTCALGDTEIEDAASVSISYPGFFGTLKTLRNRAK